MDHLYEARHLVKQSDANVSIEGAQLTVQQAIAHALIALTERLDTPINLNASNLTITSKGFAAVAEMEQNDA